jgi:DNA polymerase-3 subunit gamma/tau
VLLHRIALLQQVPGALADDDPEHGALMELAGHFNAEELQLYYQISLQGRNDIGLAPDEYAGFTMTLLRMLAFAPGASRAAMQSAGRPVAAAAESKKNGGGASWTEIVDQLGVSGMTRMLAQHCELVSRSDTHVELAISKVHERLLDKPYQDRLKAALRQRFGGGLKITIGVGNGNGNSPAELADREREQRQAQAVAEIEQDPFVRELVEGFDARVVESTIKPIQ